MLKISVVLYVDDCFKPRVNVVIICLALLCFDKDLKVFLLYVMSSCETFPLLFGMHTEYGDKKAITSSIRSPDVCFPLSVVHESLISFPGMPWMREKYESSLFVACMEIWLRKISFSLIPHSVSQSKYFLILLWNLLMDPFFYGFLGYISISFCSSWITTCIWENICINFPSFLQQSR